MGEDEIREVFDARVEKRWEWVATLSAVENKAWTEFYNTYFRSGESYKDFRKMMLA